MEQIDRNIFVETRTLGSNYSMILTNRGVVLVDSPHKPTDAIQWRREIESKGEIIYLVNTDHHIDHVMGNFFLGGEIISHEITREKMIKESPTIADLKKLLSIIDPKGIALFSGYSPRLPTITINDSMTLFIDELTLEIKHMKGHTPNSLMIYIPEKKILFAGDNVCEASLPSFREACLFAWLKTLKYIMKMDVKFIVPGHGKICTITEVKRFHKQIGDLVNRVKKRMDKGVPKNKIMETVRFVDKIHSATESYQGYPEEKIEEIQRMSISHIYDQLIEEFYLKTD